MGREMTGMPEWLTMAMPVLLVLGVLRALYGAAQRKGKSAGFPAAVAVFVGTWITALSLWSLNYVVTLPGHDVLKVSRYGSYLLGDLALLAVIWAGIVWVLIRVARARADAAS